MDVFIFLLILLGGLPLFIDLIGVIAIGNFPNSVTQEESQLLLEIVRYVCRSVGNKYADLICKEFRFATGLPPNRMPNRIKTSITLDRETLRNLQAIARREDRSVSYILERFIRRCVKELAAGNRKPGGSARLGNRH